MRGRYFSSVPASGGRSISAGAIPGGATGPEPSGELLDQNILCLERGGPLLHLRGHSIVVKFARDAALPWIDHLNGILKRGFARHYQFVVTERFQFGQIPRPVKNVRVPGGKPLPARAEQ